MGATHHLVLNVRFRESKSTVKVKSVLKPMGAFSIYVCDLGDVRALFLEERESRHATALRGARSRFEGPIGSFSMYVCVKVMSGYCFWR